MRVPWQRCQEQKGFSMVQHAAVLCNVGAIAEHTVQTWKQIDDMY